MRRYGLSAYASCLCLLFSCHLSSQQLYNIQALTEENFPLQFSRQTPPMGFAVDIVENILENSALEGKVEILPWARAYKIAMEQPNVLLFSTRRTEARENKFKWANRVFTEELMPNYERKQIQSNMVLLCHKNARIFINTIEEAKRYSIASLRGDYITEYLLDHLQWPEQKIIQPTELIEAVSLLQAKRVDMAVMENSDYATVLAMWGFDPEEFTTCLELKKPVVHLYFSFSLSTEDVIVDTFRNQLEKMHKDGSYQRLYQKWFSKIPSNMDNIAPPISNQ